MGRLAIAGAVVSLLFLVNSAVAAASGWSIEHTPNPSGSTDSELYGMSCISSNACIAVGFYTEGTTQLTLAERWNGTKWTIQPTPNPTGAHGSNLDGVSCVSANSCTAVGAYSNGTAFVTLAERWNGTKWSIQPTLSPTGASYSYLEGVSCASAIACIAVGYYVKNMGPDVMLAERWNGTKWSIEPTPPPMGSTNSELRAASCTSESACTAVGFYFNGNAYVTLAERWNGIRWSIKPVPHPTAGSNNQLYGASCVSASACTAVGLRSSGTTQLTLAERWNGTKWSIVPSPNPTGGSTISLNGVSCALASACTAVGQYSNATTQVTLAERWNGSKWSIEHTPNPTGGSSINLNDVWCASTSACIATGLYFNGTAYVTLAERWKGA